MNARFSPAAITYFLIANVLVLGSVAYAFVRESRYPDFYYFTVQEDEYLEWASFWAFLLAAAAFFRTAIVHRPANRIFPWYLYGLALFCFVVAMEEISWGQRLVGFSSPEFFRANNLQGETNIHNFLTVPFGTSLKAALSYALAAALPL